MKLDLKLSSSHIDDINVVSTDKMVETIKKILESRHKEKEKHDVSVSSDRLKIACPYCGDSKTTLSKKRGTIYLATNTYKCWNGGCFVFKDLQTFFNDFGYGSIGVIPKLDMSNFITSAAPKVSIDDLYDIKSQVIDREVIMKKMGLCEIVDHYKIAKYLQSRKQDIYDRRMAVNPFNNDIVFFNMSQKTEKVIGIQIRKHTPPPKGSRFISFDYSRLMKFILKEDFDEDKANSIKMISLTYNIMNVDVSKNINVFESSINSHHFDNSIACWGSNSILKISTGNYIFDDDDAGRSAMTKLLDDGLTVFMWTKFKRDYPIYKNDNDMNDVFIRKTPPKGFEKNYLTNSKLDIINL